MTADRRGSGVSTDRGSYTERRPGAVKEVMGRPDDRYSRYVSLKAVAPVLIC